MLPDIKPDKHWTAVTILKCCLFFELKKAFFLVKMENVIEYCRGSDIVKIIKSIEDFTKLLYIPLLYRTSSIYTVLLVSSNKTMSCSKNTINFILWSPPTQVSFYWMNFDFSKIAAHTANSTTFLNLNEDWLWNIFYYSD